MSEDKGCLAKCYDYKGLEADYERAQKRIAELEADVERLRRAYEAACKFIDESLCDPDITVEQWAAYEQYITRRKEVEAASGSLKVPPETTVSTNACGRK